MICIVYLFFFFNHPATTEIYTYLHTLSLHDALPIFDYHNVSGRRSGVSKIDEHHRHPSHHGGSCYLYGAWRSEEHTSELQSLMRISYAVFCLKKKKSEEIPIHRTNKER